MGSSRAGKGVGEKKKILYQAFLYLFVDTRLSGNKKIIDLTRSNVKTVSQKSLKAIPNSSANVSILVLGFEQRRAPGTHACIFTGETLTLLYLPPNKISA